MTKRRKSTKKSTNKSSKILLYIAWGLGLISLLLVFFMSGYYLGFGSATDKAKQEILKERVAHVEVIKKLKNSLKLEPVNIHKQLQELLYQERNAHISKLYEADAKSVKLQVDKKVRGDSLTKPHLAIIIDDVCSKAEVKAIKKVGLPLTMSFFPPTPSRPNTPELATKQNIYMVHLPMQAMHWSREQPDTLHVGDSQEVISHRIEIIKKLFPRVHYINNHTGSKFTADTISMYRLIYALNKNNINFIDSRTTAQTKVPLVMKKFGKKYVARDVFLDDKMNVPAVIKQIKIAIKKAKEHGLAIAIGHPHKSTLEALRESKQLLQDVDLVYINALYK